MAEIFDVTHPMFQPAMRVVTAITRATNASVTTNVAHDYGTGLIVKFYFPVPIFGMSQINGRQGTVTVTSPTTFTIDIDSTHFDAFSVPGGNRQYPQVVPVAEVNSLLTQATRNVLP